MGSGAGIFYGVGVGPGQAKMLPVAAFEALQKADVIIAPRARSSDFSIARQCLVDLELDESRFREVIFNMDPEREQIDSHYADMAQSIVQDLKNGKTVAYLTIGDSLTYSTYSYLLSAIQEIFPGLAYRTFPGITSYAAAASMVDFPLGQGKERMLILPCPDDVLQLKREIETHDIVVLMKIGKRFADVISLLQEMRIEKHCALVSRLGLSGEVVHSSLSDILQTETLGYLTTMLIRKTALKEKV
ncbi:MAG: precorrin-2 C(20)-methyltransferase [Candidatus Obscuribacterales bacterium]|nr:precorrin-2 C(20)-methyltransferase [Candidatus Obscuribacterales bacterium]